MTKFLKVGALLICLYIPAASVAAETAQGALAAACRKDCPKAKSDEEAHRCAEKKASLNKDFKKSQCWDLNEEYEKKAGATTTETK